MERQSSNWIWKAPKMLSFGLTLVLLMEQLVFIWILFNFICMGLGPISVFDNAISDLVRFCKLPVIVLPIFTIYQLIKLLCRNFFQQAGNSDALRVDLEHYNFSLASTLIALSVCVIMILRVKVKFDWASSAFISCHLHQTCLLHTLCEGEMGLLFTAAIM